jgi:hypothetical protein
MPESNPNHPPGPRATAVEFLPAWYARLRRRRRILLAQAGLTLALAAGLALWAWCEARAVSRREQALDRVTELRDRRREENQLLTKLGRHVEALRILSTIDRALPAGVRLTELNFEIETPLPPDFLSLTGLTTLRTWRRTDEQPNQRLRVRLRGEAPSAVEGSNFLGKLSKVPFFEKVTMTEAADKAAGGGGGGGGTVSDFQIVFLMNLTEAVGE